MRITGIAHISAKITDWVAHEEVHHLQKDERHEMDTEKKDNGWTGILFCSPGFQKKIMPMGTYFCSMPHGLFLCREHLQRFQQQCIWLCTKGRFLPEHVISKAESSLIATKKCTWAFAHLAYLPVIKKPLVPIAIEHKISQLF